LNLAFLENGKSNGLHNHVLPSSPEKLKDNNVLFGLVILIWYTVSVGHNLLNKRILEQDVFPCPVTLTLLQLASITTYSFIYIKFVSNNDKHVVVSVKEIWNSRRNRNIIIFLSFGKFLTLVFSQLSLARVDLALTHTVKGSLPLFVVFLSRVFLATKHDKNVYLSLVPIVIGVALVSYNPSHQSTVLSMGIMFAFLSTLNLALLNVFSKKLLSTTFSAISLLHLLTKVSLIIFVPFYVVFVLKQGSEINSWSYLTVNLPFLLVLDGVLSFSQNILAFSLLSMCSPLTYSIANCSKRVAIISLSFVFFSIENLTLQSLLGIGISLFGIFAYNVAKHAEKMKQLELPTMHDSKTKELYNNGHVNGMNGVKYGGDTTIDFDRHSLGSFYNV